MKKTLCVILSAWILLCAFPFGVLAEGDASEMPISDSDYGSFYARLNEEQKQAIGTVLAQEDYAEALQTLQSTESTDADKNRIVSDIVEANSLWDNSYRAIYLTDALRFGVDYFRVFDGATTEDFPVYAASSSATDPQADLTPYATSDGGTATFSLNSLFTLNTNRFSAWANGGACLVNSTDSAKVYDLKTAGYKDTDVTFDFVYSFKAINAYSMRLGHFVIAGWDEGGFNLASATGAKKAQDNTSNYGYTVQRGGTFADLLASGGSSAPTEAYTAFRAAKNQTEKMFSLAMTVRLTSASTYAEEGLTLPQGVSVKTVGTDTFLEIDIDQNSTSGLKAGTGYTDSNEQPIPYRFTGTADVDFYGDMQRIHQVSDVYYRSDSGATLNTSFGHSNTNNVLYAVRTYTRALSEAELAQNHFADLAGYFQLELSLYQLLSDEEKAQVHDAMKAVAFGTDAYTTHEAVQAALDEATEPYRAYGCGSFFARLSSEQKTEILASLGELGRKELRTQESDADKNRIVSDIVEANSLWDNSYRAIYLTQNIVLGVDYFRAFDGATATDFALSDTTEYKTIDGTAEFLHQGTNALNDTVATGWGNGGALLSGKNESSARYDLKMSSANFQEATYDIVYSLEAIQNMTLRLGVFVVTKFDDNGLGLDSFSINPNAVATTNDYGYTTTRTYGSTAFASLLADGGSSSGTAAYAAFKAAKLSTQKMFSFAMVMKLTPASAYTDATKPNGTSIQTNGSTTYLQVEMDPEATEGLAMGTKLTDESGNTIPYRFTGTADAEFYGDMQTVHRVSDFYYRSDASRNTSLAQGGTKNAIYAVRTYTRALSEAELAQNHFADLAGYFQLDLTAYQLLSDGAKAQVHDMMKAVAFGTDAYTTHEEVQAKLDEAVSVCPAIDILTFRGFSGRVRMYNGIRAIYTVNVGASDPTDGVMTLADVEEAFDVQFGTVLAVAEGRVPSDITVERDASGALSSATTDQKGGTVLIPIYETGAENDGYIGKYTAKDAQNEFVCTLTFGKSAWEAGSLDNVDYAAQFASDVIYRAYLVLTDRTDASKVYTLYLDSETETFGDRVSMQKLAEYFYEKGSESAAENHTNMQEVLHACDPETYPSAKMTLNGASIGNYTLVVGTKTSGEAQDRELAGLQELQTAIFNACGYRLPIKASPVYSGYSIGYQDSDSIGASVDGTVIIFTGHGADGMQTILNTPTTDDTDSSLQALLDQVWTGTKLDIIFSSLSVASAEIAE